MNEKENKKMHQFQVGYMLNTELNINKAFKEHVEINLANTLSYEIIKPIRKMSKK